MTDKKDDFGNVKISSGQAIEKSQPSSSPMATVRNLMVSKKAQIAALLPKHIDANRLMRLALLTMRQTPELLKCTPESLIGSVLQAAQLGLEPGDALGQAYLVPYGKSATFQMGYQGMIDLAKRSGEVQRITAHVVYEKDVFEFEYGLEEKLIHKPDHRHQKGPVAVYAVAHFKDGSHAFEVLSVEDIERARNTGKQGNSPAWRNHWPAMARKTAIRRLFKFLPISIEMSKAVALDEQGEAGIDQRLDLQLSTDDELTGDVIDVEPAKVEAPKTTRKPRSDKGQKRGKKGDAQAEQKGHPDSTDDGRRLVPKEQPVNDGPVNPDDMDGPPSGLTEEERAELEAAKEKMEAQKGGQGNLGV
jgi:recombination protein RecT